MLTALSSFGNAHNSVVPDFSHLGDEHELHQPCQSSAFMDHLRSVAVAQTVGNYPQGFDVKVAEVLWENKKHKMQIMWRTWTLHKL